MNSNNSYDDIKKAIDALLKINSTVKRKKKAYVDKQKDLFTGIIMALQAVQTRTILTQTELKLDFSSYDEMFLQVIDSLILLHFGKEGYEVISFYLWEKFNPDGSVNDLLDEDENVIPSETIEDIWNILLKIKSNNEK
jgi:hypothetical protein